MGKQLKQWQILFRGGSKITANNDYSRETKRHLFPERKAIINLDSILKSRGITLPTKVHLVKAIVFPVVMYGCKEWDHKEGWALRNWCLWTVVWRRLLRVPWTARRSNQSILKEINPEYSNTGRADVDAKAPKVWPSDAKSWFTGKDPWCGKD